MLKPRPNYLNITNLLIDLFNAGSLPAVKSLYVEPHYGYVAQLTYHDRSRRYMRGAAVDINTGGAIHIARDKGYTKLFLREMGYQVPHGRTFLMPVYAADINRKIGKYGLEESNISDVIPDYIEQTLGWPCFVKANDGARGYDVYRCTTRAELHKALAALDAAHIDLVLVEEQITLPEYRVVIFDDRLIACYAKLPLTVTGDGHSTISQLINLQMAEFTAQGRRIDLDEHMDRIRATIERAGYDANDVLSENDALRLLDVANLSSGGAMTDDTHRLHAHWRDLCVRLTRDLNLRLAGIDFMCADITNPDSDYRVLEVNAAPSLSNFASIGSIQTQIVADLYREIFNTPTGRR